MTEERLTHWMRSSSLERRKLELAEGGVEEETRQEEEESAV